MAASCAAGPIYLCHFCSHEFSTRSALMTHFPHCQTNETRKSHEKKAKPRSTPSALPILNQIQQSILHMVHLHHQHDQFSSQRHPSLNSGDINQYLQIPLSNLYSRGYLSSCSTAKQSSFDDDFCTTDSFVPIADAHDDVDASSNLLNNKLTACHVYKYSRRERDRFYARIKRATMKKHAFVVKSSRTKDSTPFIFNQRNFIIQVPTKIHSRQRISSSSNVIYPLLFDSHFHQLVQLPTESIFAPYLTAMKIFFHLIHSIASQEFQFSITSYDQRHQLSYTSYSLMHLLRQTMFDSETNLKRNYFQSFDDHHHHPHPDQESFIPPLKIRRYDHSSYEIKNRSTSSTASSSSSGMSITQVNQGQQQEHSEDRRRSETRPKKFSTKLSDQQINSNCSSNHAHVPMIYVNDHERKEMPDFALDSSVTNDVILLDHSQSNDRSSTEPMFSSSSSFTPIGESAKRRNSPSPHVIREQANDAAPKYQSVALNDGARIRIVNCSHDNSKYTSTRNQNGTSTNKRLSQPMDENWTSKTTRVHTRKVSSTNSKTSDVSEVSPPYQPQSVLLTNSEISHGWLTHGVFYRCHACSHEEFFVVLSRECMILHISSKHGNMEENFKQRVSNFLNNQGRALKIYQHYLKWQQPWSEKEIDQIFQLSNIHPRTNGSL